MSNYHGDKTGMNITMQDVAAGKLGDGRVKGIPIMVPNKKGELVKLPTIEDKSVELEQEHWKNLDENIQEYNKKVLDLDKEFTEMTPMEGILIRCFHIETKKTEGGLYLETKFPVGERTQNGLGIRETLDSPWKYSTKAIVVSTASHIKNVNVGDIIQIHQDAVMPTKLSRDTPFLLKYSYTLPDYPGFSPPTNLSDKNYGYMLVPINEIAMFIKKKNENDTEKSS